MYPISAAALAALPYSHTMQVAAVLADPTTPGALIPGMRILGGSVTVDRTAQYRRQCNLQIAVNTVTIPGKASDALAPYGNTVQLFRGLFIPANGLTPVTSVLIPLGVFRLSTTGVGDSGDEVTVSLTGYDSSRTIARNKFTDVYFIAAGINYATAIAALIADRRPDVVTDIPVTAEFTPQMTFDVGSDPWQALTDMCAALGWECFFTVDDVFKVQPVPDPAITPTAMLYDEGELSHLLTVGKEYDDEPGFNGVVFTGESTSIATPVSATTWDNDPNSPTYYLGKYKKNPDFQTSPYIASTAQASAAGVAYMLKNQGGTEQTTFDAIPNPALDASDVIQVKRGRIRVDDIIVVESIVMPLGPDGSMSVTGAKRRTP
jgi:hypothetical protein